VPLALPSRSVALADARHVMVPAAAVVSVPELCAPSVIAI
jgi:hypothetical protein